MNSKMLKLMLAATVAWPAVSSAMPSPVVFAEEAQAEIVENEIPADEIVVEETVTEDVPVEEEAPVVEEEETAVEEDEAYAHRPGTNVGCDLQLNVLVDGNPVETTGYMPGVASHSVQVGGNLVMQKVWNAYNSNRNLYIASQQMKGMSKEQATAKFHTKSLVGSWTYNFQVNPAVVTVNTDILLSPDAWQTAFETGSGAEAAGFFSFMKCSNVTYDETTGAVSVTFVINHNGTGKVGTAVIDNDASCKPCNIQAYSPEGAFTIKAENFKKGAIAVYGNASFSGEIDMDPWMAIGFPFRFKAEVAQPHLTLDVADATATFDVVNGTWADGSSETRTVTVPVDVFKLSNGSHVVAGTLTEEMIPEGMIAAEGFVQEEGAWNDAPVTAEYGTVFYSADANARLAEGLSVSYTYTFPEKEPGKPEPIDPAEPTTPEEGKDESDDNKEENKGTSSKAPTSVATGFGALIGMQAAAVAGIAALFKRKRK